MTQRLAQALPAAVLLAVTMLQAWPAQAQAAPPQIRTGPGNAVPACVTPDKLDAFIRTRNPIPLAKFRGIGALYKRHGEAWRVRWDYAFFQMVIETNYLLFRRGDGSPGDVSARQNNFAGIGATGGGVPGDSYPDVSTGVLAQIQHLVAYSGERVAQPVAPRTQLKQDYIIAASQALRRPVTFADLRNRWAADRHYARSIETIAERFRAEFCQPGTAPAVLSAAVVAPPLPQPAATPPAAAAAMAEQPAAPLRVPQPEPAVRPGRRVAIAAPPALRGAVDPLGPASCRVLAASYGGERAVLIRADTGQQVEITVLTVVAGFERSMVDNYVRARAAGGRLIGEYASPQAAMAAARELCPTAG